MCQYDLKEIILGLKYCLRTKALVSIFIMLEFDFQFPTISFHFYIKLCDLEEVRLFRVYVASYGRQIRGFNWLISEFPFSWNIIYTLFCYSIYIQNSILKTGRSSGFSSEQQKPDFLFFVLFCFALFCVPKAAQQSFSFGTRKTMHNSILLEQAHE